MKWKPQHQMNVISLLYSVTAITLACSGLGNVLSPILLSAKGIVVLCVWKSFTALAGLVPIFLRKNWTDREEVLSLE